MSIYFIYIFSPIIEVEVLCTSPRDTQPGPLPDFVPLYIDNNNKYRRPNRLYNIDLGDTYGIFKLFFTDELLDKLVNFTN